jgi:hypothetical protein
VYDAIGINVSTGDITVQATGLALDGVQMCELAWSAQNPNILYIPNDQSSGTQVDDALITFDITLGKVTATTPYAAGLNAVVAWQPPCE